MANDEHLDAEAAGWQAVARSADVEDGYPLLVGMDGQEACVYRVGDDYYATASQCTHGDASLADGLMDGHLIECPLHEGTFDVRTGEPLGPPCTRPLECYDVRIDAGAILLRRRNV